MIHPTLKLAALVAISIFNPPTALSKVCEPEFIAGPTLMDRVAGFLVPFSKNGRVELSPREFAQLDQVILEAVREYERTHQRNLNIFITLHRFAAVHDTATDFYLDFSIELLSPTHAGPDFETKTLRFNAGHVQVKPRGSSLDRFSALQTVMRAVVEEVDQLGNIRPLADQICSTRQNTSETTMKKMFAAYRALTRPTSGIPQEAYFGSDVHQHIQDLRLLEARLKESPSAYAEVFAEFALLRQQLDAQ